MKVDVLNGGPNGGALTVSLLIEKRLEWLRLFG
jgi:hypothetical protein